MNRILLLVVVSLFLVGSVSAATRVGGYFRSNGRYVNSYYKSSPNSTRLDNYSTKGNYNPYTGKKGHTNPYKR